MWVLLPTARFSDISWLMPDFAEEGLPSYEWTLEVDSMDLCSRSAFYWLFDLEQVTNLTVLQFSFLHRWRNNTIRLLMNEFTTSKALKIRLGVWLAQWNTEIMYSAIVTFWIKCNSQSATVLCSSLTSVISLTSYSVTSHCIGHFFKNVTYSIMMEFCCTYYILTLVTISFFL